MKLRNRKFIVSILTVLMMVVTLMPSMAFADTGSNVLKTNGGFKIVDADDNNKLVTNVTIQIIATDDTVMGYTLCSDGENFNMDNVGQGVIKSFKFTANGYEDTEVLANDSNKLAGQNWFNSASSGITQTCRSVTVMMTPKANGIHSCSGTIVVQDSSANKIPDATFALIDRQTYENNKEIVVKYQTKINDENGEFSITGIAPGTYYWCIMAEGYNPNVQNGQVGKLNQTTAQNVTITTTIPLDKKMMGTATISGTITDDNGSAISGATVQLKSGSTSVGAAVTTGEDGTYTINNVEAGTYTVEASATDYVTDKTAEFVVTDGESITGKDIQLKKEIKVIISGKVLGEDGNPISGYIPVVLLDEHGTQVPFASGSASSTTGEFTLGSKSYGSVAPGKYSVKVDAKGYLIETKDILVEEDGTYEDIVITLREDPIKDATIGGTIYVLDGDEFKPLANGTVSVVLYKDGTIFQGPMSSNYSSGTYSFKGYSNSTLIKAGTYVVEVKASGNYAGAKTAPIYIEDKTFEQIITQDIYLGSAGMNDSILSGQITAVSKDKDTKVKVALLENGTEVATADCDENGRYVFTGIQPMSGKYTLKASADGYISDTSEEFELTAGESLCGVNLTIHKPVIRIAQQPDKKVYKEGELLDLTGLKVELYYDDDAENAKEIELKDENNDNSIGYTINGYALKPGTNTIVVSYTEGDATAEATFDVTVQTDNGQAGTTADDNDKNKTDKNKAGKNNESDVDDSAQTGDDMNFMFPAVMMILAGLFATITIFSRKRANNTDR